MVKGSNLVLERTLSGSSPFKIPFLLNDNLISIFMRCLSSQTLPKTFSWSIHGHEFTEDEHVEVSHDVKVAILNLRNAQLLNDGTCVCEAHTTAETHRCAAMLTFTFLPDIFVFSASLC